MTLTSYYFFAFILACGIVYYLLPKKLQWVELLIFSLCFYWCTGRPFTIAYMMVAVVVAYFATILMDRMRETNKNENSETLIKCIFTISLVTVIGIWFVIKARGLWLAPVRILEDRYVDSIVLQYLIDNPFVAALGMGYYTCQIISYLIDCYWQTIKPQKNFLRLFLYIVFFPQLITGPISRYSQMEQLYQPHRFSYQNICFGTQRILWGVMKKLVLAERIGVFVQAIRGYTGFYSWLFILLYPLQLYADFSGCLDIVLGVAEIFDIHLPENFNNPFLSKTSQEFWQRWHITLGSWARDYVLYPLLKTKKIVLFGRKLTKRIGKKQAKFVVNAIGVFCVWLVMGIWHGEYKTIVGVSLWYWAVLMVEDLMNPCCEKVKQLLNMKTESFSWRVLQGLKVYLMFAVGVTFFSANIQEGIFKLKDALKVIVIKDYANPWIFFDGSLLKMGLEFRDINIIIICIALMITVGVLREKYGYARIWIQKQSFIFRWLIWIILFELVLIYGKYGPNYDAAQFIYQGF